MKTWCKRAQVLRKQTLECRVGTRAHIENSSKSCAFCKKYGSYYIILALYLSLTILCRKFWAFWTHKTLKTERTLKSCWISHLAIFSQISQYSSLFSSINRQKGLEISVKLYIFILWDTNYLPHSASSMTTIHLHQWEDLEVGVKLQHSTYLIFLITKMKSYAFIFDKKAQMDDKLTNSWRNYAKNTCGKWDLLQTPQAMWYRSTWEPLQLQILTSC